jgi:error-prone DNA polymerase
LAAADAFGSLGLNRREALWQVLSLDTRNRDEPTLFDDLESAEESAAAKEPPACLPEQSLAARVAQDYLTFGMSLAAHPMSLLREQLDRMKAATSEHLQGMRHGAPIRIAGLVLIRQRPATAKGTMFFTLEDEHGVINLIVRQAVYEKYRKARKAVVLWAEGEVQRQGPNQSGFAAVIHVMVRRMANLTDRLKGVQTRSRDFR